MEKIIFLICMISVSLFAGIDGNKKVDFSQYDKVKLSKILKSMTNEVSKSLPMQMDKITTLARIYTYNKMLVYVKEVDVSANISIRKLLETKKDKQALKKVLYEQDKNTVCNEVFLSYLLKKKNAIIEYQWQNKKAIPIFEYTVEYKDCLE
ncbi:MAG: hypothetical protein COA66_00820 [Arcobacter sp.]|nr:MAG: hypothetical protein COA66_00820 [Arcobacter sp.]